MMETEKEIFDDLFEYLRTYNDPPSVYGEGCAEFWKRAGDDLTKLLRVKWHEHPLAMKLGFALIVYIENKSKDKAGDKQ